MGNHISTSPPTDRSLQNLAQQIDAKLTTLFNEIAGLMIDESGNTAGRSTYDAEAKGFVYYDSQAGLLYQKQSAASADWSDAFQFETGALQNIVEDTSPQLGGSLDVNGQQITSTGDVVVKIGDIVGAKKLDIKDNAGVSVAEINSDGQLTCRNSSNPLNDFFTVFAGATALLAFERAAGIAQLYVDPKPIDGTSGSFVLYDRFTNTTGNTVHTWYLGDGTTTSNHGLHGKNNLASYFCNNNGSLVIGGNTNASGAKLSVAGAIAPNGDNLHDLGTASYRFDDVYATNATIQTSDSNDKDDFFEITDAEKRVALAMKNKLRTFKWKKSKLKKGAAARKHSGITAQDVEVAFAAEGLDAGEYGVFVKNIWWEAMVDEIDPAARDNPEGHDPDNMPMISVLRTFDSKADAPPGAVKKTRLGLRYNELWAFIIAAL